VNQAAQPEAKLGIVSFDFGTTASTATMHAPSQGNVGAMDPGHVQAVREGLVALLQQEWPDDKRRTEFATEARDLMSQRVSEDISRKIGPEVTAETETEQLVRWLSQEASGDQASQDRTDGPPQTAVLDTVWVFLARFVCWYAELQDWGNLKLHQILGDALERPAFAVNYLYRVPLENTSTYQVDSTLVVRDRDIDDADLTNVVARPENNEVAYRGLKRRVPRPVPLPADLEVPTWAGDRMNSDVLVGQAYRFLGKKAVWHSATKLDNPAALGTVVVTYPTTYPPAVRQRLYDLVKDQVNVDQVVTRFDEGIAALMFVLMRDFGGDDEVGIETFRARSRMVEPGRWQQNLLVIDIGGGTTDIALTRLELRDATEGADQVARKLYGTVVAAPRRMGRVYFLHPEVLGSTGHPQYGGDLLTLRVFYWIKARIADAVRESITDDASKAAELLVGWPTAAKDATGDAQAMPLAQAVVDYPDPGPGPRAVVSYLREMLPTRTDNGPDSANPVPFPELRLSFIQLWQTAVRAKEVLAAGKPFDLSGVELSNITTLFGGRWKDHLKVLTDSNQALSFSVADFNVLARSVLAPAVELAVDLARRRLAGRTGEVLDGIALTGRSAGFPLIRHLMLMLLTKAFGERNRGGGPMAWNPALVKAEHAHPKEAASIGACWAQAKYENNPKGGLAEITNHELYKTNRDTLVIDVDNLVVNLPCRFSLAVATGKPLDLLNHGHPLEYADDQGTRFTRTRWLPAQPDVTLVRYLDQEHFIRWGHYHVENRVVGELGSPLPAGLRFQIQIDDQLVPTLSMCLGPVQRFAIDGSTRDLARHLPQDSKDKDGRVRSLPWNLCVRTEDEATGEVSWRRVVLEAIPTVTDTTFGSEFRAASATGETFHGCITEALPAPSECGWGSGSPGQPEYVFGGVVPGEDIPEWEERIPAPIDPDADPRTVTHWAVLDERGTLHVPEPGYPRYQQADSLTMMGAVPGSVYRTPMEPPQPDLRLDWDPFTGEH